MTLCRHGHEREPGKQCRECVRIRSAEWYAGHKEYHYARCRRWVKDHPEQAAAHKRVWRELNKDKGLEATKRWQREHRERNLETNNRWRRENSERVNRNRRLLYSLNPEKFRKTARDWARNNPDKVASFKSARRARKINAYIAPVTYQHLKLLMEGQDGLCRYCKKELGNSRHLDHRIPLARGGKHEPSNVCWSCSWCNQSKGSRTESEFLLAMQKVEK